MGFLIDTCVWIDVERGLLAPADVALLTSNQPIYLSPITIAELRFGVEACSDQGIRQKRMSTFRRLMKKPSLPIDATTGDVFGSLAASLKAEGKQHRYRVQDLWIASQAIQYSLGLLTRNKADFQDIPGLNLVFYSAAKKKPT